MYLEKSNLTRETLAGQIAVITGAGRGIGFETARCLIWLGAKVILAEVDQKNGAEAEKKLREEFGHSSALFVYTDISRDAEIKKLKRSALKAYGKVDIVINNATITPMGAVKDVPITDWDASYGVNLRGPVLLTQAFLPGMLERKYGVIVCVSSSGAGYMGAYESFKSAQVHLANTLDDELSDSGVYAFCIGPGLVRTPGAQAGIAQLAPMFGKTIEEFYAMSEAHILPVEEAGAGFAAAVALAASFQGQEISARQALVAAGVDAPEQSDSLVVLSTEKLAKAQELSQKITEVLQEQFDGWKSRTIFERQWMLRDFKKYAGMTVEQWLDFLHNLQETLAAKNTPSKSVIDSLMQLEKYYLHMQELARGYQKNQKTLAENLAVIDAWRKDIQQLLDVLAGKA